MNTDIKSKYINFFLTLIKWIFWGSIIGVVIGSASALLLNLNDYLTDIREKKGYLLFLLPVGGAFIGYMYQYHGKGSRKGNDLVIEYLHYGQGQVPLRMGPIVFVATFITHLLGGSTGREGAAIQMGTSIAAAVNRVFKINENDRKILIMSGVSGGFGSAFGVPIAGTLFGMEFSSLGKMKYEALIPCFVASFVGYEVTEAWGVEREHHIIKSVPDISLINVGKIILLGIIFSLVSVLYSQLRHEIKALSEKYIKNLLIRAAVGGLIIIALTYILGTRDYLGRGLPIVEKAFEGNVVPLAFLFKLIFTAITMGTGFRGGEVIPLFFMGATLGNTLSGFFGLPTSFLAAIGQMAVFAGATNVPLTTLVFSIELFDGKGIEFFFIACVVSYIFSGNHSVYASQKVYEPKSRLFSLRDGITISAYEKKVKNQKNR